MFSMMIVDDEKFIAESLSLYEWEQIDVKVEAVFLNAQDAISYVQKNTVDIVLTDICMHGVSGLELARTIKQQNSKIKIICISAYDNYEYLRSALKLGVEDYILKPIDKEQLMTVVSQTLQDSEKTRDLELADADIGKQNIPIDMARDYIRKNYASSISLESVAGVVNLNSAYLSFLFKKVVGMTFSDYVNQCRIEAAAKLLKNSNYNINEIAEMSGYNEPRYFSDKFKKKMGVTPSEYRKEHTKQ